MAYKFVLCCLAVLVIFVVVKCHGNERSAVCGFPDIPIKSKLVDMKWDSNGKKFFQENDTVTYECKGDSQNFHPDKARKICQKNGTWLGEPIQCHVKEDYNTTKVVINQKILPTSVYFEFKKSYTFTFIHICYRVQDSGFSSNEESKDTCPYFPIQEESKPSCTGTSSCKNVTIYSFTRNFGKAINISSISLYRLSNRKCSERPEVPVHGIGSMISNTSVNYRCKDGYQLEGHPNSTCNNEIGIWEPPLPKCVALDNSKGRGPSDPSSIKSTPSTSTNGSLSSDMRKIVIPIVISFIGLIIVIFLIWIKRQKRCCFSPKEQLITTNCKEINMEAHVDNSNVTIYENIVTLNVNPSPLYAQLSFNNSKNNQNTAVSKKKFKKHLTASTNQENQIIKLQDSTESEITYATISHHTN